jgi:ABC-type nitrate/sulfonate/bicarbonate transport system substrate-binding protein
MYFLVFSFVTALVFLSSTNLDAQTTLKKVRMGIQSSNIGFPPFHVAYHKGFYRDQGIDLEIVFMSTQAVNAAFVRGAQIVDYSFLDKARRDLGVNRQ